MATTGLWVTIRDLGPEWETSDYAQQAVESASYLMWAMSGRKYTGVSTVTERYVRFAPLINTRLIQEAAIINSRVNKALAIVEPWVSAETRIRLRGQPVQSVETVRNINGGVVSADSYYIVDHSTLQFTEGALIVPADIELTYTYGTEPPVLGKMAARRVAIEFIKLWSDDDSCALPQRVTSVTRQGVTYTVLDTQDFIQEMRMGIYEIDLFLKVVNPARANKRSKVFSADIPKARRYTPKAARLPIDLVTDIVVHKAGGTKTILLDDIGASQIAEGSGWVPEVIIRSWEGSKFKTLPPTAAIIDATSVDITVGYSDAVGTLKLANPGTWDLYASKDGETIYITSGNLTIDITS